MNLTKLMSLAEASGFAGGSAGYVDECPGMSLSECTAALPMFIMESQAIGFDETRRHNDLIVEAVSDAMAYGRTINEATAMSLNEGALDTIKSKISAFFAKIKKFIKSIIAKLKVAIDRMRMTGQQLWATYGKDKDLQKSEKLKDLTFDGYKFGEASFRSDEYSGIDGPNKLIRLAYNDDAILPEEAFKSFGDNMTETDQSSDDTIKQTGSNLLDSAIEKLGDLTSAERVGKMVSALTNKNLGDDWAEGLRKELWADKYTFTYGSEGFDVASVGNILKNPVNLDKIRDEYTKLDNSVSKYENELNRLIDENKKAAEKVETQFTKTAHAKAAAYINKYMEAVKDAYAAITGVNKIRTSYEEAKYKQARDMFSKMIGAVKKGGKKDTDNNDVEIDEDLILEIED